MGLLPQRSRALWTPSALPGLTAWWDASDLSTITQSSGNVSQWDDKSGNGYHCIQGTEAAQPATGRDFNGLNAIDFDGAGSEVFFIDSGPQPANSDCIILAAVEYDDATVGVTRTIDFNTGSIPTVYHGTRGGGDAAFNFNSTTSAVATTFQTGQRIAGGYRNGSTVGVGFGGTYATAANGAASGTVTTWRVGWTLFDGAIGELIVAFNYALAVRQKAEGYLAHKWGVTLAAGHPYLHFPPRL